MHFIESGVQSDLARISCDIKMVCDCPKVYLIASYVLGTHQKCGRLSLRVIFEFCVFERKKQMDTLPPKTRAWNYVFVMKLSL